MHYFTVFLVCSVFVIHQATGNIVIAEPPDALLEYIKHVYEFYSNEHDGYNSIVINSNYNIVVDTSLQYFNTRAINSIFLLNLNLHNVQYRIHQVRIENK